MVTLTSTAAYQRFFGIRAWEGIEREESVNRHSIHRPWQGLYDPYEIKLTFPDARNYTLIRRHC